MAAIEEMISPRVDAALFEAGRRRDVLATEIANLALPEFTGEAGAKEKRFKLEKQHADAAAEVERLTRALAQAEQRDATARSAELQGKRRAQLAEFEKLMAARRKAAQDLDAAIRVLAESFGRLEASTILIESMKPLHCSLPGGYQRRDLRTLVAHVLYKHSDVVNVGDKPLPGAASPDFNTQFAPSRIPSAEETISREGAWLLTSMKSQIDRDDQEIAA
jgi:hypothetical protein